MHVHIMIHMVFMNTIFRYIIVQTLFISCTDQLLCMEMISLQFRSIMEMNLCALNNYLFNATPISLVALNYKFYFLLVKWHRNRSDRPGGCWTNI